MEYINKKFTTKYVITRTELERQWIYHDGETEFAVLDPYTSFNKIKKFKKHKLEFPELCEKETSCPICLEVYSNDSNVIVFPCDHYCHVDCLQRYVESSFKSSEQTASVRCFNCRFHFYTQYAIYKRYNISPKEVSFLNKE